MKGIIARSVKRKKQIIELSDGRIAEIMSFHEDFNIGQSGLREGDLVEFDLYEGEVRGNGKMEYKAHNVLLVSRDEKIIYWSGKRVA